MLAYQSRKKKQLSSRLEGLRRDTPSDFPRKPRGVDEIPWYKANEFKFILVYCGPIVLQGILPPPLYKHFLLLHSAIRLLCWQETAVSHAMYAKSLYTLFFNLLPKYYGADSQILNMHNLIHIADDVIKYQCTLDEMSAFSFESSMGKMKKMLRSAVNPLAQLCRGYAEKEDFTPPSPKLQTTPLLCRDPSGQIKVRYLDTKLSSSRPDNVVLLRSGDVAEIIDIVKEQGQPLSFVGLEEAGRHL